MTRLNSGFSSELRIFLASVVLCHHVVMYCSHDKCIAFSLFSKHAALLHSNTYAMGIIFYFFFKLLKLLTYNNLNNCGSKTCEQFPPTTVRRCICWQHDFTTTAYLVAGVSMGKSGNWKFATFAVAYCFQRWDICHKHPLLFSLEGYLKCWIKLSTSKGIVMLLSINLFHYVIHTTRYIYRKRLQRKL